MKRALVLVGFLVSLTTLTGCAADPVDETVSKIVSQVQEANSNMGAIRSELEKVAKKGEKEKISLEDLADTFERAQRLRKVGQDLMALRTTAEMQKPMVDEAKREALEKKYGQTLAGEFNRLAKEQEQIDELLARVVDRTDNKRTADRLMEEIRNSTQEFEALTRQR